MKIEKGRKAESFKKKEIAKKQKYIIKTKKNYRVNMEGGRRERRGRGREIEKKVG